jgi:enolase
MDCAASEFYDEEHKKYNLFFKDKVLSSPEKMITTNELCDLYISYVNKFPIASIEDPFDQDDVEGWRLIT